MKTKPCNPRILLLILLAMILSGCGGETPAETPSDHLVENSTPETSSLEEQAEVINEPKLSAVGPWVLIGGEQGLWAANPDGTGLSYIYDVQPEQLAIGGKYAAFIEETDGYYGSGLDLKLISLPDREVQTITELLSETTELKAEGTVSLDEMAPYNAVLTDNLAWSPDGTQLAFTSAHEGTSVDLYVYSPTEGSLTRLSKEPSQAFRPIWSPDGKHIILMGANSFGSGAGYDLAGVWVVCADGSCMRTLYEPWSGDELALGWTADDTLIMYSFSALYGFNNLRGFNIESDAVEMLWEHSFTQAALDPESGTILVVVDDITAAEDSEINAGFYFIHANKETELIPLSDFFAEQLNANVSWHAEASVFLVKMSNEFVSLSPAGEIELIVPRIIQNPKPVPSPVADLWVWLDDGILVLNGPETNIKELFPSDSHPLWGPDGSSVLFIHEGQLTLGWLEDMSTSTYGSNLVGNLRWMGGFEQ